MEIFKVESVNVAYDEDVSMIIMAKTEARALEIAKKNWQFRPSRAHDYFEIIKIDANREHIVGINHFGE